MKFSAKYLLFLPLLCFLTACFDVVDEIDLNEDGSGKFLLTVNMSRSKSKLESIMLLESFRDYKVPSKEEVTSFIDNIVATLRQTEGISQVTRTIDFNEFIFTIGFSFESVDNINAAIEYLTKDAKNEDSFSLRYSYNEATREFSRYYLSQPVEQVNYDKFEEEDKRMFNEAIYISICRFENKVRECSNKNARISKSGNAVMLRSPATHILRGEINLSNTIKLD